jgi:hypothetical protein
MYQIDITPVDQQTDRIHIEDKIEIMFRVIELTDEMGMEAMVIRQKALANIDLLMDNIMEDHEIQRYGKI